MRIEPAPGVSATGESGGGGVKVTVKLKLGNLSLDIPDMTRK